LDIVPPEARKHHAIQQYILDLVNEGVMCPLPDHDDDMMALSASYSWMATKCKSIVRANQDYIHDDFWKRLRRLIIKNNIRKLTPSVIAKLQRAIWKKESE
jgi:hypothetical protein